jgi:EAL domain-containing protein (putative c-di-GMP-specific phosphodiesterase class I)
VAPHLLHLEVTETAALDKIAETGAVVNELHGLGVHFSLDDFGTGYAAMSTLRELPIDTIKIDKSFTESLPEPDALALVRMTVSIAHELGLRVIAEGVETDEQQRILLELGCHLAQGWLYARPMAADELTARLGDGHRWTPAADPATR